MILALYRLGSFVPLPGINREALGGTAPTPTTPSRASSGRLPAGPSTTTPVFSLGIMPYITAAIVMQLMTVAIPRLQELSKEGEAGQQKITQYTRYFTLALAADPVDRDGLLLQGPGRAGALCRARASSR